MIKTIIVVGGGIGGTMTANNLVSKLYPEVSRGEVRVMLISNSPWHYYKPAFMYVAFGAYAKNDLRRQQASLLRPEIDFVLDQVDGFEFKNSRLKMRSGVSYDYDHLVVSTGCIPSPERIEGLQEAGDHFYQHDPARKLYEKISTIEKGRIFIGVTFPTTPNVPHQCGMAPLETTLLLDEFLRKRGVREQIELVYSYPSVAQLHQNALFLQKNTAEMLPSMFDARDIRYKRSFTLARVDPERKIAFSAEGEEENFDILIQTPPIRAVDAVLNSGVSQAPNNEGWLPTDRYSLQLEGFENVFVMGDTVDLPIGKAGGSCHSQSPVICDNIAGLLRWGKAEARYDGLVQAVAQMGMDAGIPLWYNYEQEAMPSPATKIGSLMCKGFNRGLYWSVARGLA